MLGGAAEAPASDEKSESKKEDDPRSRKGSKGQLKPTPSAPALLQNTVVDVAPSGDTEVEIEMAVAQDHAANGTAGVSTADGDDEAKGGAGGGDSSPIRSNPLAENGDAS